jgi:hypothetical protein
MYITQTKQPLQRFGGQGKAQHALCKRRKKKEKKKQASEGINCLFSTNVSRSIAYSS